MFEQTPLLQLSHFGSQARLHLYHCYFCHPHSHGDSIPDSSLFIPNYYSIRRDRSCHGGDLFLYVSEDVPSICLHYSTTLELLFIEFKLQQGPLLVALYYCPPSSTPGFPDLEDALVSLVPSQLNSPWLLQFSP